MNGINLNKLNFKDIEIIEGTRGEEKDNPLNTDSLRFKVYIAICRSLQFPSILALLLQTFLFKDCIKWAPSGFNRDEGNPGFSVHSADCCFGVYARSPGGQGLKPVVIYMIGISESHEMWTQSATANSVRMRFMICLDFRKMWTSRCSQDTSISHRWAARWQ